MEDGFVEVTDPEKLLEELRVEVSKKQNEVTNLEDELAAKGEEVTDLMSQLNKEEQEVARLRERLAECEPKMRDLMNQNKGLEMRNKILEEEGQKELEVANARIQELEEQLEGFPPLEPEEAVPIISTVPSTPIDTRQAVAQGATLLQVETLREELEHERARFARETAERETMVETERAMMAEEVAGLRSEIHHLKQASATAPQSPEGRFKDMIEVLCRPKSQTGGRKLKQLRMYLKGECTICDVYTHLFEKLQDQLEGNEIINLSVKQPDGPVRMEGEEAGRCLNSFVHNGSKTAAGSLNCEYKVSH